MATLKSKKVTFGLVSAFVFMSAAYTGLLYWQVKMFDEVTRDLKVADLGLFSLETKVHGKELFSREIELHLGFKEELDDQEAFLVMKGKFSPGFSPSIKFSSIPVDYPESEIFVKANPKLKVLFNPAMNIKEAELSWDKAKEGRDLINEGKITSKIDFDSKRREVVGLSLKGLIGASESYWEGGSISTSEKTFEYVYKENPRTLELSFVSDGDKVEGDSSPFEFGPMKYRLSIKPENGGINHSDFWLEAKGLSLSEKVLPSMDVLFNATLKAPESVWIPCITAKLFLTSALDKFPGVCPKGADLPLLSNKMNQAIKSEIHNFRITWPGTEINFKGNISNRGLFDFNGQLDAQVAFSEIDTKKGVDFAAQLLRKDMKRYINALESEKVVKKTSDNSYQVKLDFGVNSEGHFKITGNGVDLTNTKASFEPSHPTFKSNSILITITQIKNPNSFEENKKTFLSTLQNELTRKEIPTMSNVFENGESMMLQVLVVDEEKTSEAVKTLDKSLTELKKSLGENVQLEMQYGPVYDSVVTRFE